VPNAVVEESAADEPRRSVLTGILMFGGLALSHLAAFGFAARYLYPATRRSIRRIYVGSLESMRTCPTARSLGRYHARSMGTDFITIATFDTPPAAHLALGLLREAGIEAMLRNENIVAGAWDLGQASRGVEVQVPRPDAQRAHAMVEEASFHGGVKGFETAPEFVDAEDDVDLRSPQERVDAELSDRALKSAALGIVFAPLQLYSLWLLLHLKLRSSGRGLRKEVRKQMGDALMMDMVVIIIGVILLSSMV
jgi:hypothetical protein